jgi:hypothetical protein
LGIAEWGLAIAPGVSRHCDRSDWARPWREVGARCKCQRCLTPSSPRSAPPVPLSGSADPYLLRSRAWVNETGPRQVQELRQQLGACHDCSWALGRRVCHAFQKNGEQVRQGQQAGEPLEVGDPASPSVALLLAPPAWPPLEASLASISAWSPAPTPASAGTGAWPGWWQCRRCLS